MLEQYPVGLGAAVIWFALAASDTWIIDRMLLSRVHFHFGNTAASMNRKFLKVKWTFKVNSLYTLTLLSDMRTIVDMLRNMWTLFVDMLTESLESLPSTPQIVHLMV